MSNGGFWMQPAAKWITVIGSAIVGFGCCCCGMYTVNAVYLIYLTDGNLPVGFQQGYEAGAQLGRTNPLYAITSLGMFCLPPVFMVIATIAGYFLIDMYQKRTRAANPPESGAKL